MNYKVIVSEQAERDLDGVYSYICFELKSETSAKGIALRLRGAMTGLSVMPKRYRVYPLEPWLSSIQKLVFKNAGEYDGIGSRWIKYGTPCYSTPCK